MVQDVLAQLSLLPQRTPLLAINFWPWRGHRRVQQIHHRAAPCLPHSLEFQWKIRSTWPLSGHFMVRACAKRFGPGLPWRTLADSPAPKHIKWPKRAHPGALTEAGQDHHGSRTRAPLNKLFFHECGRRVGGVPRSS